MHIVTILEQADPTTESRRISDKRMENGRGKSDDHLSVAEKRNLFEQLAAAKPSSPVPKTAKIEHGQQQQQQPPPPPKPIRTFAHDHYMSQKELATRAIAGDSGTTAAALKAGPSSPKPSPNPKPPLKPKPPVVLRRQHRLKTSGAKYNGGGVQGVSHEYEHILSGRSPLVVRQQNLRRSLSDDPVAYAQSGQLRVATFGK